MLGSYENSANNVTNSVVLNESTDGVSWDTKWNMMQIVEYLYDSTDQIFIPDTNHNIYKISYQLCGRYSPAYLGDYMFNPWLLKMYEGVPK